MKTRFFLSLFVLLFSTLACGFGSTDGAPEPAPAEPGSNQAAAAQPAAACDNPYYPVKNGATWEYELTGAMPGAMMRSLADVTENGFSVQETIQGGTTISSGWRCDKGALAMASIQMEGFTTTSSEGISLPFDLKEGASWSQELVYEGETGGLKMSTTMTNQCAAKGAESVTVPAGTFETLRVECKIISSVVMEGTDAPTVSEITSITWYAAGVGMVKVDNSVAGYESQYLLKSYKLP